MVTASRRISDPRAPGPMMPIRTRSLAPRTLEAANVPAKPVATLPMKFRRECMNTTTPLPRLGGFFIIAENDPEPGLPDPDRLPPQAADSEPDHQVNERDYKPDPPPVGLPDVPSAEVHRRR